MTRRGRWTLAAALTAATLIAAWAMRHPSVFTPGRMTLTVPAESAASQAETPMRSRPHPPAAKPTPAHTLPNSLTPLPEDRRTARVGDRFQLPAEAAAVVVAIS